MGGGSAAVAGSAVGGAREDRAEFGEAGEDVGRGAHGRGGTRDGDAGVGDGDSVLPADTRGQLARDTAVARGRRLALAVV